MKAKVPKKFTADLLALLVMVASLFGPAFFPQFELAPVIQALGVVTPGIAAGIYHFKQGKQDVEKEKTKQAEAATAAAIAAPPRPAAPLVAPPPPPKPKRINFKLFTNDVLELVEKDDKGQPKGISLYYAVIQTGRQYELEVLSDLQRYAELVVDGAERRFSDIHGFRADDPDLANILKTKGKCPYSSLEAFCDYEGNRMAFLDLEEAYDDRAAVFELVALNVPRASWHFDTSLFGMHTSAGHLVAIARGEFPTHR